MNFPGLKTIRQWLPMASGLLFAFWIALLVALSLFWSREHADHTAAMSPQKSGAACVVMKDGIKVCDDTAEAAK